MNGGSDNRAVGDESLTIGQLQDNLQLAMAVSQQMATRGVVNRHDMLVAVESIGLVLPADMPVNSFTEVRSFTNFQPAHELLKKKVAELTMTTTQRLRQTIGQALEIIAQQLRIDRGNTEDQWARLQRNRCYLVGFEPDQFQVEMVDEILIEQKNRMDDMLVGFYHYNELGQDYIGTGKTYFQALALEEPMRIALQNVLCGSPEAAEELLLQLGEFLDGVRTGAVVEPAEVWDPIAVVHKTIAFMDQFSGAIPYHLQEAAAGVDRYKEELEAIEDHAVLERALMVAQCIRDYLIATWRLEQIRESALKAALLVCTTAGVIRDTTTA